MRLKSLKEFGDNLENVGVCIGENKNPIEIAALSDAIAAFKFRVFGNLGGFDEQGKGLGDYSKAYLRKRLAKGKNNLQKNLVFDGNLRNSIEVGVSSEGKNVFGFTDLALEQIARYQEEQLNTDIFGANDEEVKVLVEEMSKQILELINKCFSRK